VKQLILTEHLFFHYHISILPHLTVFFYILMSKKLLPFTLVIAGNYPERESPIPEGLKRTARSLGQKMDVATNPVFKAFVAGSLSGTCSTVLFQPLDLVKTRIQQQHRFSSVTAAATVADTAAAGTNAGWGMFGVARHVLQTEHVTGLWRGILPSVTRTVPGVGIYFASLHWLKTSGMGGGSNGEKPSPAQAMGLGMAARSLAATIMIPITVLKTRFESGQFNYTRMTTALVTIYSTEGLKGLTCGLMATLARDAPYSGLYLMFYTQLKNNLIPRIDTTAGTSYSGGPASHFACGITAGFLASLVTHPADVVKTKMQIQPQVYSNLTRTTKLIMVKSGPRGFLIGFAPRMLRRALMSALAWTVYEEIMKRLGLK